jgi:glycosyltransferase involved in cell wall biosynthesis
MIPDDSLGKALKSFCRAKIDGSIDVDQKALGERVQNFVANYQDGASYFARDGSAIASDAPLVTIVAPIHRASDQDNLLRQLRRQDYPNLEAVIVINGPDINGAAFKDSLGACTNYKRIHIEVLPNETSLPKSLNTGYAVAKGAYVARFDADDLYLDRYISRSINFMQTMSADICGKQQFFVYLDALGCACLCGNRYIPTASINNMSGTGSTLIISRAVMETIQCDEDLPKGEDFDFYVRSWSHRFRIAFAPPFDHLVIRKADKSGHTWKQVDFRFLMDGSAGGFISLCSKNEFEKLV